jgi:hypothetical protein
VKNRVGLERYWQDAPTVYPKNIDVLVANGPSEVLDADQDERVEGVVVAEFPATLNVSFVFSPHQCFCSHLMIQDNELAKRMVAAIAADTATPSNNPGAKERRLRHLPLAAATAAVAPTMGDGTNWRRLRRDVGANSTRSA